MLSEQRRSVDNEHECVSRCTAVKDPDADQNTQSNKNPDADQNAYSATDDDAPSDQYTPPNCDTASGKHPAANQHYPAECHRNTNEGADCCGSVRQELCHRHRLSAWFCVYDRICHH